MHPMLEDMMAEQPELAIAPLIDVVFLLLIYFMVTSSLKKNEADLGITLPGTLKVSSAPTMPDEQIIEVSETGDVILNGKIYGADGAKDIPELVMTLRRYRLASEAASTKALITIQAGAKTKHQRTIDVMNACAAAEIKYVSFGMRD